MAMAQLCASISKRLCRRFVKDDEGVAAVEFAFVAPAMVLMFFGMLEVTDILSAHRRVTAATSALGDLTAQAEEIDPTEYANIISATEMIMAPHDTSTMSVRITSVRSTIGSSSEDYVSWSQATGTLIPHQKANPYPDMPNGVMQNGACVLVAEIEYHHDIFLSLNNTIALQDKFYLRPRQGLCTKLVDKYGNDLSYTKLQ